MDANRQAALPSLPASPRDAEDAFVINLCSSTTPMALTKPKDPALEQFKFFVSRRREDGRERFRMHMGYFPTLAVAEEWLAVVREVYPSAWAGEAPGRKLKSAAPIAATAPPVPKPTEAVPKQSEAVPVKAAAVAPREVPTLHAAPPVGDSRAASGIHAVIPPIKQQTPTAAPPLKVATPARQDLPARPASPPAAKPVVALPPAAKKIPEPAKATAPVVAKPQAAAAAVPTAAPAASKQSNIREVIAELDQLSDTGTLRVLEGRHATGAGQAADEVIKLVRPDDTQTMRAIKEDVQRKAPVYFAVQLEWSVQPIDMAKVPPLAIFNAYTLYTTEGNKEGRRWYGLRLGFFSDAISAKQVAYYVRSDFAAVAVVPVSSVERERASVGTAQQQSARAVNAGVDAAAVATAAPIMSAPPANSRPANGESGMFKLLEDDTPAPIDLDVIGETSPRKAKPASTEPAKSGKPGATNKSRAGTRLPTQQAKAKASPKKLDETLEILGADDLEFDAGRGELISESGVRRMRNHGDKRASKFTSLLDRIAAKLGRG